MIKKIAVIVLMGIMLSGCITTNRYVTVEVNGDTVVNCPVNVTPRIIVPMVPSNPKKQKFY